MKKETHISALLGSVPSPLQRDTLVEWKRPCDAGQDAAEIDARRRRSSARAAVQSSSLRLLKHSVGIFVNSQAHAASLDSEMKGAFAQLEQLVADGRRAIATERGSPALFRS